MSAQQSTIGTPCPTVRTAKGAAPETVSQRRRPEAGQFLLQVDRQTKASFVTLEAAEKAGLVIKKNFPVVRVSIYDSITGANKILELPAA